MAATGKKTGKIIIIVAPSGTGKSTLIKKLKEHFPQLQESISYTTRPMRPLEVEGKNYHYISEENFLRRRENKEFLEWAVVHSNYYGTSKKTVENALADGKILLFDLDVQGADMMKAHFGDTATVIFIEPPSLEALEKRLRERGTETDAKIEERLRNARNEILRKNDFDFLVMNDDFDNAFEVLSRIFKKVVLN